MGEEYMEITTEMCQTCNGSANVLVEVCPKCNTFEGTEEVFWEGKWRDQTMCRDLYHIRNAGGPTDTKECDNCDKGKVPRRKCRCTACIFRRIRGTNDTQCSKTQCSLCRFRKGEAEFGRHSTGKTARKCKLCVKKYTDEHKFCDECKRPRIFWNGECTDCAQTVYQTEECQKCKGDGSAC